MITAIAVDFAELGFLSAPRYQHDRKDDDEYDSGKSEEVVHSLPFHMATLCLLFGVVRHRR